MSDHPVGGEGCPGRQGAPVLRATWEKRHPDLPRTVRREIGGRAVGGVQGSLPAGSLGGLSPGSVACLSLCDSGEASSLPGLGLPSSIG